MSSSRRRVPWITGAGSGTGRVAARAAAVGLNDQKREWKNPSMTTFADIVTTNPTATAVSIDLALPDLQQFNGVAGVVSSNSAWCFSPMAGAPVRTTDDMAGAIQVVLDSPPDVRIDEPVISPR